MMMNSDPTQQPMPDYESLSSTSIRLYWEKPDNPNGIIVKYELYRDGSLIATRNGTGY